MGPMTINISNTIKNPPVPRTNMNTQRNEHSIVRKCLRVRRIVRLTILSRAYDHGVIAQFITECKEYAQLSYDYAHYGLHLHPLRSNDATNINQMTKEYDQIFQFVKMIRNEPAVISTQYIEYLNQTMTQIYSGACGEAKACAIDPMRAPRHPHNVAIALPHFRSPVYVQCSVSPNMPSLEPVASVSAHAPITPSNSNSIVSIPTPPRPRVTSKTKKPTREVKFTCDHCGKRYKHLCNLKSHQRIHTDEALICAHCNKRFGRSANLREHLRIHTGEAPYQCKFCSRKFKHHHAWKDHLRIHTGENPYQCKVCGRRFKVGHNLKVHARIHTGEKPYKCPHCNKLFRQKSGLNSHMKRAHK
eukprot:541685_1